jgi:hypothetical protein
MMDIEKKFAEVKTLQELHVLMRQLKEDGCNASEVNMYASKRRKEIITGGNKAVSKLKKIIPSVGKDVGTQFAAFKVRPKHVTDNVIDIDGEVIEI